MIAPCVAGEAQHVQSLSLRFTARKLREMTGGTCLQGPAQFRVRSRPESDSGSVAVRRRSCRDSRGVGELETCGGCSRSVPDRDCQVRRGNRGSAALSPACPVDARGIARAPDGCARGFGTGWPASRSLRLLPRSTGRPGPRPARGVCDGSGDALQAGAEAEAVEPRVTIGDTGGVTASGQVDVVELRRIRPGHSGGIAGPAFPGVMLEGRAAHVSSQAFRPPGQRGLPVFGIAVTVVRFGMSANIETVVCTSDRALVVPADAVDFPQGSPRARVRRGNGGAARRGRGRDSHDRSGTDRERPRTRRVGPQPSRWTGATGPFRRPIWRGRFRAS